jgi:cell wall-associated NlpC family hydrolase
MSTNATRWISLAAVAVVASIFALPACNVEQTDSEELTGAPENVDTNAGALSGNLKVGETLIATTGVNLRTGPSTSKTILHVVPEGASVVVEQAAPENGFYKVKHNGTIGWSYGAYYKEAPSSGGGSSGGSTKRDQAITRAKSGVGFSYWWGHGRFRPEGPTSSNKGSCSGSCPSCSHSGSYGGDCSGFVGKVWQVPSSNSDLTVDEHPYSTANFVHDTSSWSTVSRSSMTKADAMVYNSGGEGHIFLYSSGDAWGSVYAYECKGCSYGCVYDLRTVSSAYHGIRRAGY